MKTLIAIITLAAASVASAATTLTLHGEVVYSGGFASLSIDTSPLAGLDLVGGEFSFPVALTGGNEYYLSVYGNISPEWFNAYHQAFAGGILFAPSNGYAEFTPAGPITSISWNDWLRENAGLRWEFEIIDNPEVLAALEEEGITFTVSTASIPEPSRMVLFGFAGLTLLTRRRRM